MGADEEIRERSFRGGRSRLIPPVRKVAGVGFRTKRGGHGEKVEDGDPQSGEAGGGGVRE